MTSAKPKLLIRTNDVAEIIESVSSVYCHHAVKVLGRTRGFAATFEVTRDGVQPVVRLEYAAPVKIDACDFAKLMLMQTCVAGSATVLQAGATVSYGKGHTLPLSPGVETQLHFDGTFAQRSVRIDIGRAESLCSRLLNRPLDRPLRFELRPFSAYLEASWGGALSLLASYERMGLALPEAAATRLDEFMVSLLLTQHPHNYSDGLRGQPAAATPRLVREAEYLMRTDPGTTVSRIASHLGVSLRSLEAGFREWRQATPNQHLRKLRLEAVRKELLAPSTRTTVTSVALAQGFFHLARFSAYYRTAFGEDPSTTLRRSRSGMGVRQGGHAATNSLSIGAPKLEGGAASAGQRLR